MTAWAAAVTSGMLQKAGGTFTLTAEVDFGATYGLKSAYLKSRTSNVSSAGTVRLANTDSIGWRNNANGADLLLSPNTGANGILQYNGVDLATISASQTLTNKTINASSNTISNIANANIASNAAIAFSKLVASDSEKIPYFDLDGFLTPSGVTIAELDVLSSGTLLTTSNTQTGITNKSFSDSTFTIEDNSDSTKKVAFQVSGVSTSTTRTLTIPNASTTIVGTDATQTLSNKSFSDAITLPEISTPSTPASGGYKIYAKTDGKIYGLNDAGTESELAIATLGLTTKGDILVRDGTGSTRLAVGGNGTILKASSGASTGLAWLGQYGVVQSKTTTYTALITDDVILASTSGGAWTLTLPAASTLAGKVFVIKKTTSDYNELTLSPASGNIDGGSSTKIHTIGETLHITSDGTEWVIVERKIPTVLSTYTPTVVGSSSGTFTNTTAAGKVWRIGSRMLGEVQVDFSGAPGTGTVYFAIPIPSGPTIATGSVNAYQSTLGLQGTGKLYDDSGSSFTDLTVWVASTTTFSLAAGSTTPVSPSSPITIASGDSILFKFDVPITGWNG